MNRFGSIIYYLMTSGIGIIIFIILHAICLKRRNEEVRVLHWIAITLFGCMLAIIYALTVSPVFGLHRNIDWQRINLIPFKVFVDTKQNPVNLYGNIAIFIPVGMLIVLMSRDYGKWYKFPMIGAVISLSIELLQLFLDRGTDIDDIILNTLGTLIGGSLIKLLMMISKRMRRQVGIFKQGTNKCRRKDGRYLALLTSEMLIIVLITGGMLSGKALKGNVIQKYVKEKMSNNITTDDRMADCEKDDNKGHSIKCRKEQQKQEEQKKQKDKKGIDVDLNARNVYFVDVTTGEELYKKDEMQKISPASTTKMLTALVVADSCNMEESITVGEEIMHVTKDASVAGLRIGDTTDIRSMLSAMLLPSGNDAAYALAAFAGRRIANDESLDYDTAIEIFVDQMNAMTKEMNAVNSHFVRPDGYDDNDQYTTAYDLGLITQKFIKNDTLREISGSERIRCIYDGGMDITYTNTNELLCEDSEFYRDYIIGGKTGSSGNAGKCLVSAARMNDQIYIAVVMGDTDEGRWQDSVDLYDTVR